MRFNTDVVPAKAGTHLSTSRAASGWIPVSVGMTVWNWRRFTLIAVWLVVVTLIHIGPAFAVRPDEMLADPHLEARAREVGQELRCLVCRNQSIDDSDADLAHDLRVLVRQRIKAGDSNAEVIAYVRSRYGDFVLLKPPLEISTVLLWGGPALILLLGGVALFRFYRRPIAPPPAPLSRDEERRLAVMIDPEQGAIGGGTP
jgi:cytochrome c-type biogenesis protein CcmH